MNPDRDPVGLELSAIRTAEIQIPRGYIFRATGNPLFRLRAGLSVGQDAVLSPCLAFVVRHAAAGTILVDTGFHEQARSAVRREFGVPMSLVFRGLRPAAQPFDHQLQAIGVAPDSVRSVVMTHLHADHTSGMRLLPNAQFTISRPEWRAATSRSAPIRGYVGHHLPSEQRVQLVDFERDGKPFGPFRKAIDLLGDGTIRLLSTPGHTPGHLSILLQLGDGRTVLLVGDAAYTLRSIREDILPMLTVDDEDSRRSLAEVRAYMDQNPAAIVVPSHDPEAYRALEGADAVTGAVEPTAR